MYSLREVLDLTTGRYIDHSYSLKVLMSRQVNLKQNFKVMSIYFQFIKCANNGRKSISASHFFYLLTEIVASLR